MEIAFIVIGCIVGLGLICLIFFLILKFKRIKYVKTESIYYKKLLELNNETKFLKVSDSFYDLICKSKKEFDTIDVDKFIRNNLFETDYLSRKIDACKTNVILLSIYNEKIVEVGDYISEENTYNGKLKFKTFHKIEKKICDKVIMVPDVTFFLIINVKYVSPKGRNHYSYSCQYDRVRLEKIKNMHIDDVKKKNEYDNFIKEERLKVTSSLRYDVLKRDGFRCKICGASQEDGVKLHVDHIIPVSKGGKTEMSNLQTLCDRCNIGKSNKI